MSPYFYCLSTNVSFFFIVCPQLSLFVLVVTNVFSFCLFFIHQSLLFIVIVYPPMSLLVLVVTNVFILDLLFIHQCLLLDVVYPLLFLSVLVVHQFLHLLFIVYPPAQCLLLVLWIHQCLLVLAVHRCLPFVIVCPQMYPFSNSLSTMSTFRKC